MMSCNVCACRAAIVIVGIAQTLILHLHCYWKPSQNGTMLKLHCAGCLLAAFTLQSLEQSEFLTKMVGHLVMHHVISIHHGGRFMVSSVGKRNAQKAQNTWFAATQLWYSLSRVFGTNPHMLSTDHSMAAAWDLARYYLHWQMRRCLPQLALSKWAGQHGLAQHNVGTLWLCLHCHC